MEHGQTTQTFFAHCRSSPIVELPHVFSLRRDENDLSQQTLVTGECQQNYEDTPNIGVKDFMRLTQRLLERNMDIFKHIAPFCSKPSAWLFASFCIEIEKKKKSSSVHRQSHEHRQNEPPTTPPTRTTIYMTNGHPDRAWNRHVCFDIFCFVPFRYIRFSKLHSLPVFVYISFCFVPFRFVLVNFVTC